MVMHCLDTVLNKWWKEKLELLKLRHSMLLNYCYFLLDVIHAGILSILPGAGGSAWPFRETWSSLLPLLSSWKETYYPCLRYNRLCFSYYLLLGQKYLYHKSRYSGSSHLLSISPLGWYYLYVCIHTNYFNFLKMMYLNSKKCWN